MNDRASISHLLQRLSAHLAAIYPDHDCDGLAERIVNLFWPDKGKMIRRQKIANLRGQPLFLQRYTLETAQLYRLAGGVGSRTDRNLMMLAVTQKLREMNVWKWVGIIRFIPSERNGLIIMNNPSQRSHNKYPKPLRSRVKPTPSNEQNSI
jgi:hypothetical protein